jgi:hypothetical protein
MSFFARCVHDSFHGLFPYHTPSDYYQPTPQHHHQLRNIIINYRNIINLHITIIIHQLRWAMTSPVSTRTLTTI